MAVLLTFLLLTVLGTVALVAAFSAAGADRRLEELGDPFDDGLEAAHDDANRWS